MLPQSQKEFLAQLDFELPKQYLSYLFAAESTYNFVAAYLVKADELNYYRL